MSIPPATDGLPLQSAQCPLCGGANACGMVRSGGAEEPCWCEQETFSPALLARLPEARRGRACVCLRCVKSQ
ncbi:cysteine-rich CWC family protein [Nevskia soli]|uniref:cysteine-rich CWC family protein n=1 Tax=Nevskia soli TaxID=418856 RepID=UPI000A018F19